MAINVRGDISSGLHPDSVAHRWAKPLGADSKAIKAATEVATVLYEGTGRMIDAIGIAKRGRADRVSGFEEPLGRAASRMVKRAEAVANRGLAGIKGERGRLRKTVDDAFGVEPKNAAEVRARLAAMKGMKADPSISGEDVDELGREMLIRGRIAAGDRDSVLAVLQAPPWISGLSDESAARLRAEAERTWYATETAQISAIDEMVTLLEEGARGLADTYKQVLAQVDQARNLASTSDQAQALDRLAAEVEALGG